MFQISIVQQLYIWPLSSLCKHSWNWFWHKVGGREGSRVSGRREHDTPRCTNSAQLSHVQAPSVYCHRLLTSSLVPKDGSRIAEMRKGVLREMGVIYIYFFFDVLWNDEVRAQEGEMEDERGGRPSGRNTIYSREGGEQGKQMRGREEKN